MPDVEWDALYLGGHPDFPVTTAPVAGKLRLDSDALRFLVLGEVYEILVQVHAGACAAHSSAIRSFSPSDNRSTPHLPIRSNPIEGAVALIP